LGPALDAFTEALPGAPLNGLVKPDIGANWGEAKGGEKKTVTPGFDIAALYI
jgi:hypothetical protein